MIDICALDQPTPTPTGILKGEPVQVLTNEATARASDLVVDCRQHNAVNVLVFVTGAGATADIVVEGGPEQGGPFQVLPDINATQLAVTANKSFDVVVGQGWVRIRLANVAGTFRPGQGFTVVVTPFVSPGQPRVAASIVVDTLAAIQANTGALNVQDTITVAAGGAIRSGQTAFDTGTGYWLENSGGTPRLSIGNSAGSKLRWDGSTLLVKGTIQADAGYLGALSVQGVLDVLTGGALKSGATGFNAGTGWWLDYNAGTPRFFVGNAAGSKLTWDGSTLTVKGTIQADAGYLGALSIQGVLNIATSGGIFQGTGTFASPTTALKIYNSGGVGLLELWGGGVKQVYMGTDGSLYAGGGNVKIDATGIQRKSGQSDVWASGNGWGLTTTLTVGITSSEATLSGWGNFSLPALRLTGWSTINLDNITNIFSLGIGALPLPTQGTLVTLGSIFPGTGAASQTSRSLSDDGSRSFFNGGLRVATDLLVNTASPAALGRATVAASADGEGVAVVGNSGASPTISPGFSLYDGTTIRGALGLAAAPNRFAEEAVAGDIVLRSEDGRVFLAQKYVGPQEGTKYFSSLMTRDSYSVSGSSVTTRSYRGMGAMLVMVTERPGGNTNYSKSWVGIVQHGDAYAGGTYTGAVQVTTLATFKSEASLTGLSVTAAADPGAYGRTFTLTIAGLQQFDSNPSVVQVAFWRLTNIS